MASHFMMRVYSEGPMEIPELRKVANQKRVKIVNFFPTQFLPFLTSVADPGCLSRILIFIYPGSRILDPGSRIQKQEQKRGKNFLYLFL